MAIEYLNGKPWSEWTREERYFCSVLYHRAAPDPGAFAKWVVEVAELPISTAGEWELGYEVCLYRDMLWCLDEQPDPPKLSKKRTFDLCLFGEKTLIIIEAKVFEGFRGDQNAEFKKDKRHVSRLPGMSGVGVQIVALASSTYFENVAKKPSSAVLKPFDGKIRWAALADHFGEPLFRTADALYKSKPGKFCAPMKRLGRV